MGTWLSAFCASRPADRLPAGDAAVVGLLAQGHRYRRDGSAHAARVDDGKRQACLASRNLAGPLDCRIFMAAAGNRTSTSVLDRRGAAKRSGTLQRSFTVLVADRR